MFSGTSTWGGDGRCSFNVYDVCLAHRVQPFGSSTGLLRCLLPWESTEPFRANFADTAGGCSVPVVPSHGTQELHRDTPSAVPPSTLAGTGRPKTPSELYVRSFRIDRELDGHSGCVNSLAVNASGELLLSGSDDLAFCLYDTLDWRMKHRYRTRHSSNIFHAVFVPGKDNHVVSCARDGRTLVTDLERCEAFYKCRYSQMASSVAVSPWWPDTAYVSYLNGFISRIDTRTHRLGGERMADGNPFLPVSEVRALAVHERWPFLVASGTSADLVYLHDVRMCSLNPFAALSIRRLGRSGGVSGLSFSSNGTSIAVNYRDENIYVIPWLDAMFHPDTSLSEVKEPASCGFASLLGVGAGGNIAVVPVHNAVELRGRKNAQTMFKEVTFMEDDNIVCSGCDSGNVLFWRSSDGLLIHKTRGDDNIVNVVLYNHRTSRLLTSGIDDSIKVLGPTTNRVAQLEEGSDEPEDVSAQVDSRMEVVFRRILFDSLRNIQGEEEEGAGLNSVRNIILEEFGREMSVEAFVESPSATSGIEDDDEEEEDGSSSGAWNRQDEPNEGPRGNRENRAVEAPRIGPLALLFANVERAVHLSLSDLIYLTRCLISSSVLNHAMGGPGDVLLALAANDNVSSLTGVSDDFSEQYVMGEDIEDDTTSNEVLSYSPATVLLLEESCSSSDSVDGGSGSDGVVNSLNGEERECPPTTVGTRQLTLTSELDGEPGATVGGRAVVGRTPGDNVDIRPVENDDVPPSVSVGRDDIGVSTRIANVKETFSDSFQHLHRVFNTLRDEVVKTFRQWSVPNGSRVQIPRWDRCVFGLALGVAPQERDELLFRVASFEDGESMPLYYYGPLGVQMEPSRAPTVSTSPDAFHSCQQRIMCLLSLMDVVLRQRDLSLRSTEERRAYWIFRCVTELFYVYYFMALGNSEAAFDHLDHIERYMEYRCVTALGSVNSAYLQRGGKSRNRGRTSGHAAVGGESLRTDAVARLLRTIDCEGFPPLLVPIALKIRVLVLSQRKMSEEECPDGSSNHSGGEELPRNQAFSFRLSSLVNELRGRLRGHPNIKVKQGVVKMLREIGIVLE